MGWIDAGSHYEWDVPYTSRAQAFNAAMQIATQYGVIAETKQTNEAGEAAQFAVITRNDIGETHSPLCRCGKCVPL